MLYIKLYPSRKYDIWSVNNGISLIFFIWWHSITTSFKVMINQCPTSIRKIKIMIGWNNAFQITSMVILQAYAYLSFHSKRRYVSTGHFTVHFTNHESSNNKQLDITSNYSFNIMLNLGNEFPLSICMRILRQKIRNVNFLISLLLNMKAF